MLVFALGSWRRIGWRISALAACIFAIGQRKSEAVVWISAMPEFLVFFFGASGLPHFRPLAAIRSRMGLPPNARVLSRSTPFEGICRRPYPVMRCRGDS